MKAVLQRASRASVVVAGETVGAIDAGVLILLGVLQGDDASTAERLAERCARYRFFADEADKMNLSLLDIGGAALVVSQFTLAADGTKGRRPSFDGAEKPGPARELYLAFVARLRALGVRTETGRFGANMEVHLVGDGPVTLLLDATSGAR